MYISTYNFKPIKFKLTTPWLNSSSIQEMELFYFSLNFYGSILIEKFRFHLFSDSTLSLEERKRILVLSYPESEWF